MTKKQTATATPVMQFLTMAWHNSTSGVSHSYAKINHTMWRALTVALGAFEFQPDDFSDVVKSFRSGYWLDDEQAYATAIANGNTSAAMSIEKHLGREPIIADDVQMPRWQTDANTHMIGDRQKERLHVGCSLTWRGEKVTVTSFKGNAAIACSYQVTRKDEDCPKCGRCLHSQQEKILHRYEITREAVIGERKERKRRQEIWDALAGIREKDQDGPVAALAKIGVITWTDFARAPLKKLERVLASVSSGAGR